jgi:hypothetical protein
VYLARGHGVSCKRAPWGLSRVDRLAEGLYRALPCGDCGGGAGRFHGGAPAATATARRRAGRRGGRGRGRGGVGARAPRRLGRFPRRAVDAEGGPGVTAAACVLSAAAGGGPARRSQRHISGRTYQVRPSQVGGAGRSWL